MAEQPNQTQSPEPTAVQHPAAMLTGPGHLIVYGNGPFLAEFGTECIGLPAAEALVTFPRAAFDLLDRVLRDGTPLKRRVTVNGSPRSLTAAPRRDIATDEVYGVMLHLVPRE